MPPEKDVFADAQLRNEHEFLMNYVDAEIVSLVRGLDLDGSALPGNLPAVCLIRPGGNLHERGFTGAVFADQCVNFARTHLEGHVIEYGDAAEGLCDVLHPEERFRVLRRQLFMASVKGTFVLRFNYRLYRFADAHGFERLAYFVEPQTMSDQLLHRQKAGLQNSHDFWKRCALDV